jgi:hypothetical protein
MLRLRVDLLLVEHKVGRMKTFAFGMAYAIVWGLLVWAVLALFHLSSVWAVAFAVPGIMLLRPLGRWTRIHVLGK